MPFHHARRKARRWTAVTGRTPNRRPTNLATPSWAPPALLLLVAALAACGGGGEGPTPNPQQLTTQPEATDPGATTAQPQATQDAEPQPTAGPEATERRAKPCPNSEAPGTAEHRRRSSPPSARGVIRLRFEGGRLRRLLGEQ